MIRWDIPFHLYQASRTTMGGAFGPAFDGLDIIYVHTTRASESDDFTNPLAVSELNPVDRTYRPGWISPDGCRLYLTSGSPQTAYLAVKPPN